MTCDKHDYHVVVIETFTEFKATDDGNTNKTWHTYELYCLECGHKLPPNKA